MALVLTEIEDGVATVTLNHPEVRNAVSLDMNRELDAAFDRLEADESVGAVVLTGTAPAFSAGANLDELLAADDPESLGTIYAGFLRVAETPLPTVAAVNGAAVGAGMNFALACDVILAGRSAMFESRFLQIAIHPGGGHTWRLRNICDGQTAMAMVLFGERLDGPRAAEIGLAWKCVDDDALLEEARRMARRPARVPRELAKAMKQTVNDMGAVADSAAAVAREVGPQAWSMAQPEFKERVAALKEAISNSTSS
ncbi:enoyl-CoA hydratase-related protein [Candidatus Poriferisocius sp.]|uniref:enoyl-CoA hydratase-related protein n=1 Tax=Candidatus Poriferisocius sp. TaxID=3101276 RepID=UPI003B52B9CC